MQKHSHHTTRQVLLVNIALLFREESFDSAELGLAHSRRREPAFGWHDVRGGIGAQIVQSIVSLHTYE